MVVGLGGGGLPVFLNRHCGMDVQSVELDPVVVDLARRHFGFADSATLQVMMHVVTLLSASGTVSWLKFLITESTCTMSLLNGEASTHVASFAGFSHIKSQRHR